MSPRRLPPPQPLPAGPVTLVVTTEDLHTEGLLTAVKRGAVSGIVGLTAPALHPAGSPAAAFEAGALADGLDRASANFGAPVLGQGTPADLAGLGGEAHWVTAYAPVGPVAGALSVLERTLGTQGQHVTRLHRPWDLTAWPKATHGFFRFKTAIPDLLLAASV